MSHQLLPSSSRLMTHSRIADMPAPSVADTSLRLGLPTSWTCERSDKFSPVSYASMLQLVRRDQDGHLCWNTHPDIFSAAHLLSVS